MRNYFKIRTFFFSAVLFVFIFYRPEVVSAYWLWSSESGKFVSSDAISQDESDELLKHALSFRQEKKDDRAVAELENLLHKFPSSRVAPEAQFQIGLIYEESGDYSRAFESYKKLTENYPQSEKSDEVIERIFKIGQQFLGGYKEKVAGVVHVSRMPKAVEVFEHIVKIAPFGKFGDQAQFQIGVAYKIMGRYREAVETFQKFVDRYPNSALIDDAYFQLAESSYSFSKKATRDQYAVEDAITNISNYLSKYPASSASEKVLQLKKEIEEQDAEKNFRIGLYYEEQNELESARLYFEDIAGKYAETSFGRKSAEKLKMLGTSIEAIRKNQQVIDEKMEEVEAKLKGLDFERDALKEKIKSQGNLTAESKELKQLEEAKTQLEFRKNEMQNNLERREISLKSREASWRGKKKNFDEKRKEMKTNPAPELAKAFERWEQSLKDERAQLDKERHALVGFQSELGLKPGRMSRFRVPFFSKRQLPLQQVVNYKQKDLEKIRSERQAVEKKRFELERQLSGLVSQAGATDQKAFESDRQGAVFQSSLGAERTDLKVKQDELASQQEQLKALIEVFHDQKLAYQQEYGIDFLRDLKPDLSAVEGESGLELEMSRSSKQEVIQQLQQEKARLVDTLVEQKRLVATLSNAFDSEVNKGRLKIEQLSQESKDKSKQNVEKYEYLLTPEELALDQRALRKRIKFIEREMRKRFDEIEDWNKKKQQALDAMDRLMNQDRRESLGAKVLKPVTFPVRFMFWLTRSLTFGLSSYDKQVIRQAKRHVKKSGSGDNEDKIRSLQQDIELQTILIQSRHQEIQRMSDQVKGLELRLQAVRKDDQVLRHVFLKKESALADESLRSADQIVAQEDRLPILIQRIDEETKKLQALEGQLNQLDEKLLKASQASDNFSAESPEINSPVPAQSALSGENIQKKKELEDELVLVKQKIETDAKIFQSEKKALNAELYEFYKKRREGGSTSAASDPPASEEASAYEGKDQKDLEHELLDAKNFHRKLIKSEQAILDEKSRYLEKELKRSRGKDDLIRHQAILSEQDRVKSELNEAKTVLDTLSN